MTDKIMHFHLKDACLDEDNPMRFTTRLYADVVDMTNNAIVDACVKEARRAGINDVYLLDRNFVLDALREKIQGTQQEKILKYKIQQLEADNAQLNRCIENMTDKLNAANDEAAKLQAERDALMTFMQKECYYCKHNFSVHPDCPCMDCDGESRFEWRGVQKEE